MKIVYVNNTDLPGRIFNGYNLMNSLNEMGHECNQLVLQKVSSNRNVEEIISKKEKYISFLLKNLEMEIGAIDLLYPYFHQIALSESFQSADIVHYQLLHNRMLSMYDLRRMLTIKKAVWTLHDPWLFTGHCVHPMACEQWKSGCKACSRQYDASFPLYHNTAGQMWEIKRRQLENLDIDVVVSTDFMLRYVKNSPITAHFTKVHKIPFGVDLGRIKNYEKAEAKRVLGIPETNIVIGIRDEENEIKGTHFFVEAMKQINPEGVAVLTIGHGKTVKALENDFFCLELGWQNDLEMMDRFYSAVDIFVMPSLAESFGLMAIEAMAHECAVVCFKGTVLEEITDAGVCGLAADYKNADALADKIKQLLTGKEEREARGKQGRRLVSERYRYEDYVKKHIKLYQTILEEKDG